MPKSKPFYLNFRKHKSYSRYHYHGNVLYWVILLLVFSSLISLILIKVDVTVQSRGVVNTLNKLSPISIPITARVTQVSVCENLFVQKGDTLLKLDQSGLEGEIKIKLEQLDLYKQYINDIEALVSDNNERVINTKLYQKEQLDYLANANVIQGKVDRLRINYERTKILFQQGVLANVTLLEDSFQLKEAEDELLALSSKAFAKWENQKRNYAVSSQEIKSQIKSMEQKMHLSYITAPFNGFIINFNGVAKGSIVSENEIVAKLSPQDDLIVESYVSPSDIGLINIGMGVKFQVDAFNYNQWGLLSGNVIEIANDVTMMNKDYVYLVKSKLSAAKLSLSNGKEGSLKKGMSLTGRFVVTRRTLFQLLFDNLDDWLNPKIIKTKNS